MLTTSNLQGQRLTENASKEYQKGKQNTLHIPYNILTLNTMSLFFILVVKNTTNYTSWAKWAFSGISILEHLR